jgi:PAS domain S-box-containing protein
MSEHDLLHSVEQARQRLAALRARLERPGTAPGSAEVASSLQDLHETLEKLQARYSMLCEVLDRTGDAIFAKDPHGRYMLINPTGARMLGKSVAEILGQDDRAFFEGEDAQRIMDFDREVMAGREPCTLEETLLFQGVRRTLLTTKTAWYARTGELRGLIGTSHDVTERRRAERETANQHDRLRSLAAEIVMAEEQVRRSLAANLHSGLGQEIALARLKLSSLRRSANPELSEPLKSIDELIEQADRSIRSITFQLSPPPLNDLGLVPALEWLGEDTGGRYGLAVRIEDDGSPKVADERIRVILFRAVRELLVNAVTHGGTGEAVVRLGREDGFLRIVVEDRGVGFDSASPAIRGHGLFGIGEQLRHVGGSLHVDSAPGSGTKVTLMAPLESTSLAT